MASASNTLAIDDVLYKEKVILVYKQRFRQNFMLDTNEKAITCNSGFQNFQIYNNIVVS